MANLQGVQKQQGAIMVEVLIGLFFVVVVFMGHIGTQAFMQTNSLDANSRAQAQILVNDMVERMQANRNSIDCYAFSTGWVTPDTGTGATARTCNVASTGGVEGRARADQDLLEWHNLLVGSNVVDGAGNNIGGLIKARGCIVRNDFTIPPTYSVAVAWEGATVMSIGHSMTSDYCGYWRYGSEFPGFRRSLSAHMQFADLDN